MILLDRDGVLNVDQEASVRGLADLVVERGAAEGCTRLKAAGHELAVITNQSAVGRGWMTLTTLDEVNAELDRRLDALSDT